MNKIPSARTPGNRRFAAKSRPEADRGVSWVPKPNPKKRPLRAPTATPTPERKPAQLRAQWTEPQPLVKQLPAVAPFDPKLLPPNLRLLAQDLAERMQVPLEIPAMTLLATLGGVCNRRVQIQPKQHDSSWVEAANLWGAIVAPSGTLKSPVINEVTSIVHAIEAEMHRADGNTDRRLITNDATPEKLHEILTANPGGIFVLRDEFSGWLAGLEKQGREQERALFLEAWNGNQPFKMDRIGRGSIHAPHNCVTLFGGIQPDRLQAYVTEVLRNGSGNDGLLQRFQLLVLVDKLGEFKYLDRKPNKKLFDRFAATCRRIAMMDAENPLILRFSPEAQEFFVNWFIRLQVRVRSRKLKPYMAAHLAKYAKLMPALALLLALSDGPQKDVGLKYAQRAAGLCRYLEGHAHRVYASGISRKDSASALGDKLREGWKCSEGKFTLRDAYRSQWTGLKTPQEAEAALQVLVEAGWVKRVKGESGTGRPSSPYCINPRIYESHHGI